MTEQVSKSRRLASLDVFRGLTIAGMIFVNMVSLNAPSGEGLGIFKSLYMWIGHAPWHNSWNLADFVFPFFLHIAGMAMAWSFASYTSPKKFNEQQKNEAPDTPSVESAVQPTGQTAQNFSDNPPTIKKIYLKLLLRIALLFVVGLLINGTIYALCDIPTKGIFNFSTLRIMGVLQRIALSYAIAAIIVLRFPPKVQWGIAGGLLTVYWLLLTLVAAPDAPAGTFGTAEVMNYVDSKKYNIASFVDRTIIPPAHFHAQGKNGFDPEGLFSTLPAITSVLLGYFNGIWVKSRRMPRSANSSSMAMFGLGAIVIGTIWGKFFPLNKALWTSSYVLFMGGWALLIFAALYELIDVRRIGQVEVNKNGVDKNQIDSQGLAQSWILPLAWMGKNALFAFVGSVLMIKVFMSNNVDACGEKGTNIYKYLVKTMFGWAGAGHDTVLFAAATVLLWSFLCYLMYRMRWFIKL
jgi:predicted acyltransferase